MSQWKHDLPSGSSGSLSHFLGLGQRTGSSWGIYLRGPLQGFLCLGMAEGREGDHFGILGKNGQGGSEFFPEGT